MAGLEYVFVVAATSAAGDGIGNGLQVPPGPRYW